MRYQSFLIKYAEIGIKGKNRHIFEEALVRQIKHALKPCEGNFAVHRTYGRVFVECLSDYEYSEVTEALSRVFGISGICPIKEMPVVPIEELREAAAAFMKSAAAFLSSSMGTTGVSTMGQMPEIPNTRLSASVTSL